jgi:uncharacterized membrane protein
MASPAGIAWRLAVAAGIVAYPVLVHLHLSGGGSDAPTAALYGLPHAAAYLFLLWLFGRTLVRGREPLVTRLARSVRGALPPELEAYTRRLTLAWCAFFAAQLAVSALLLGLGLVQAWSLFVNVLNLPLVALMFAADYLYRLIRYRHLPQSSITEAVRAFAQDRASRSLQR